MRAIFKISWLALALLGLAALACSPLAQSVEGGLPGSIERDVVYGSIGDIELTMDIYQPEPSDTGLFPAILFLHGGAWSNGDKKAALSRQMTATLLSRGYVLAAVNYRLAPRFQFPAQIEDVKCAVRFLRAEAETYNIDPERIGAWGESAGGHLAALLGLTGPSDGFEGTGGHEEQSSKVGAVLDMYGPADLSNDFPVAGNFLFYLVFGTTDRTSEAIRRASPVSYVNADAPPFLILHGDQDTLVPLHQSQELYERLKESGAPAELIVVENGGHGFDPGETLSPGFEEIKSMVADFFDRSLK